MNQDTSDPGTGTTKPVQSDNPYNIDYAREKRLRNMFIGLIGIAFLLAAVLVVMAFIFDIMNASQNPVVEPEQRPGPGIQTRGTNDEAPRLVARSFRYATREG